MRPGGSVRGEAPDGLEAVENLAYAKSSLKTLSNS
jgi:hypothetical protein